MPIAIVTGSGGLDRSESVRHFVEAGYDVVGIENDMRARFFGPDASTAPQTRRLLDAYDAFRSRRRSTSATPTASTGSSRSIARGPRARDPHRGAALARLGRVGSADRLHGQRERDAQPARGDAAARPRPPSSSPRRTRSTATGRTPPARRARDAPGAPRGPRVLRRHPDLDVDRRCLHSLFGASKAAADLLVQEYGRYFGMPTVCFRGGASPARTTRARGCTGSSRT